MIQLRRSEFYAEMIDGAIVVVRKRRWEFVYPVGEPWSRTCSVVPVGKGIRQFLRWLVAGIKTGGHRVALRRIYRQWQRARVWRTV